MASRQGTSKLWPTGALVLSAAMLGHLEEGNKQSRENTNSRPNTRSARSFHTVGHVVVGLTFHVCALMLRLGPSFSATIKKFPLMSAVF